MANIIQVPGTFDAVAAGKKLADASQIYDGNKKQSEINEDISTEVGNKYTKPSGGIPAEDLSSDVQTSLSKANSAIQQHQDISGKADKSTTLAGYGITDAYTKSQVDAAIDDIDVTEQLSDYAKKTEVTSAVAAETTRAQGVEATKANASDVTTALASKADKTEVTAALADKANTADVATSLAAKQDTISDLSTIRSGAALGATAKQPATTIAGYGITDAYTKQEVNNLVSTPHQNYVTVATKADLDAITTGSADTVYRVSNYDGTQVDATKYAEYAWDGTQFMLLTVKSSVGEVFDVSEYNSGAIYETLSQAIAVVPTAAKRGGMSIKFIQITTPATYTVVRDDDVEDPPAGTDIQEDWAITSGTYTAAQLSGKTLPTTVGSSIMYYTFVEATVEVPEHYTTWVITKATADKSEYVQYRLMSTDWSNVDGNWAIADEGVYVDNPEFVYVKTDAKDRILWAIKKDGSIYYGAGVPQQVIDYINEKIAKLSLDEYNDIVTFLGELIEGNTLATLLNTKVDKVTGKSLIDSDFAVTQNTITNPEFFQVTTDDEGKILEGIKKKGVKVVELPFEVQGVRQETVDNPEYIQVVTDSEGKIIEGTKNNGNRVFIGEIEGLSAKISAAINSVVIPIKELLSQQLNKVFTKNNNILWLGTSIPRGAQYPTYSAQKCGYVCTNNAYGESFLCWSGEHPSVIRVNSGKSLTATVAELEAMFRQDVTAGTITEAQLEEWKDKSYERSVLPYINGTNETQVSMIVLDHGFNDKGNIYAMMQDVESIDWSSKDRSNFVGAFNYLRGKIQEVNPTIKIVIAGYFQNTYIYSNNIESDYHSKEICEMQELIAKHYSISIMKAWEHTQINNEYIPGTNDYISNFNTKYNTSYTKHNPDSDGNIQSMQLYCPDCVHPHSDLTGKCNRRLNAVYAKLLKDLI